MNTEKEIASQITNAVNALGFDSKKFCESMSREHRTLQQNFMRDIIIPWIQYAGSEDYKKYCVDDRNEATYKICKQFSETINNAEALPYI